MKFILTVSITAIAIAMFKILVPENKFKKQISFLTAGVFILTLISAATGETFDFSLDDYEYYESERFVQISQSVSETLRKQICDEMSDKVKTLLNENGIFPEEIHIIVNISDLYSINITQVKLVFKEDDYAAMENAVSLLEKELDGSIKISAELR